jgi:hypothetical protein
MTTNYLVFALPIHFAATQLASVFLSEIHRLHGTPKKLLVQTQFSLANFGNDWALPWILAVHINHKLMARLEFSIVSSRHICDVLLARNLTNGHDSFHWLYYGSIHPSPHYWDDYILKLSTVVFHRLLQIPIFPHLISLPNEAENLKKARHCIDHKANSKRLYKQFF